MEANLDPSVKGLNDHGDAPPQGLSGSQPLSQDHPAVRLAVRDVDVAYGEQPVVRDVRFELERGTIGCLLGPSGCGKTTLLRAIAGFEPVSRGQILIRGQRVSRAGWTLAPEQRQVGMVFQDFALFPHLTVARNVGFGLRALSRRERQRRIDELLELVGLSQAARRYPHELSGGMQQRVALARAMAPQPDILLLDEPFSSMDAELREQLAREVRAVLKREDVTAVLVTHDQLEAFAMADRIGVMNAGSVHQWDTGFGLYHQPADRFVADFIGQGALLPAHVLNATQVRTELGRISGAQPHGLEPGSAAEVLIRPDDLVYDESSPRQASIVERAFRGAEFLYTLQLESGAEVLCLVPSHHRHAVGETIGIRLEADHLVAFACPDSAAHRGHREGTAL
ncbi:ABC transporter ATP-binding protein [Halochromatium glycolicum]|uniref:ABC transporter ATP-binding protein n=1 Tax=Halochromatium glycolicum TaxID=85075 RepID=A0AAJ0XAG4_9GAMM|nr:ABC transporter ATP-binding protein [Halochromatium glycolicum]MBK1705303.1 ABC transporter ATP-binding protein [Halochromatium glycolicum]